MSIILMVVFHLKFDAVVIVFLEKPPFFFNGYMFPLIHATNLRVDAECRIAECLY
jgi:hypothetical protein